MVLEHLHFYLVFLMFWHRLAWFLLPLFQGLPLSLLFLPLFQGLPLSFAASAFFAKAFSSLKASRSLSAFLACFSRVSKALQVGSFAHFLDPICTWWSWRRQPCFFQKLPSFSEGAFFDEGFLFCKDFLF